MALITRDPAVRATRHLITHMPQRDAVTLVGGSSVHGLVLGSTNESTTVIDLSSQALVRWRVPWPAGEETDLALFDVVEAVLAEDLERDDLAQPESVTLAELPRRLGTYRGRRVRVWLERLVTPADGPLFGFRGPSAPYWEFRGERPSVALVAPDRGPQLLRRPDDGSTWVRFGWFGDDIWLLCEDAHAIRTIESTRRTTLSGKELATALGFRPTYVLTTLSAPVEGHCYKSCTGLLPRG
ncbi:MAG TPA: hypothetical protein PLS29_10265 [Acidimicrobiales bacterium]|nr:MAG: hypothetical protein B7Z69_04305 [Actinobacteria bacterium 21-73-9]HQU27398.1 hypothetical protein [Acidimicrobiales bacterium]